MDDIQLATRVFPEGEGTGTADDNEDWDSAGYFGGMHAKDNASDYVETGLLLTVDFSTLTADMTVGLAFIKHTEPVNVKLPSDNQYQFSASWDHGTTFAVDADAVTGLPLTADAENRIWLATDLSENDAGYVRVEAGSPAAPPPSPRLLVGKVDTAAGVVRETNREPTGTFDSLDIGGFDLGTDATDSTLQIATNGQHIATLDQQGEFSIAGTLDEGATL